MDLRARFGLPVTRTDDTMMVVAETLGQTMALIVDKVVGLENLASNVSTGSISRSAIDPRYALGFATVQDRTTRAARSGQDDHPPATHSKSSVIERTICIESQKTRPAPIAFSFSRYSGRRQG